MGDTLAGYGSMRFPSAQALNTWLAKTGGVIADAQRRLDRRSDGEVFALDVSRRSREVRFAAHVSRSALAAELGSGELRAMANLLWTAAVQKAEGSFELVVLTGKAEGLRLTLAEGRAKQEAAAIVEDDVLGALSPYLTKKRAAKAPARGKGSATGPLEVRYRASARPQRVRVEIEVDYRRGRDVGASYLVESLCTIVAHGCGGSDVLAPKVGKARAPWGDDPPDELRDVSDVSVELTLAGLAPTVLAAWVRAVLRRFRVRRLAVLGEDGIDRGPSSLTTEKVRALDRKTGAVVVMRHPDVRLFAVDVAEATSAKRKGGTWEPRLVATIRTKRRDLEASLEAMANALQLLAPGALFFPKRVKNGYEIHGARVPAALSVTQAKAVLENGAARLGRAVDGIEWHLGVRPPPARRKRAR